MAPFGGGDSCQNAPVVGTTAGILEDLSAGLAEGRPFATESEAVEYEDGNRVGWAARQRIIAVFLDGAFTGGLGLLLSVMNLPVH